MSAAKTQAGERLPYLIAKLKTPRIGERLEETARLAREEKWSYERFLEVLLEAEVFARDASGSRNRIRHASFPAHKTLEDFDFTAQPAAERPLLMHLGQLAWIDEHANVCFFGPPRWRGALQRALKQRQRLVAGDPGCCDAADAGVRVAAT